MSLELRLWVGARSRCVVNPASSCAIWPGADDDALRPPPAPPQTSKTRQEQQRPESEEVQQRFAQEGLHAHAAFWPGTAASAAKGCRRRAGPTINGVYQIGEV